MKSFGRARLLSFPIILTFLSMVVVRGYLTPVPQVTRKILFTSSLDREVLSKSSFQLNSSEEAVPQLEVSEISSSPSEAPPPSELSRTRRVLSKINPFKKDDEEPLKQKLLKLGLAAFLSVSPAWPT